MDSTTYGDTLHRSGPVGTSSTILLARPMIAKGDPVILRYAESTSRTQEPISPPSDMMAASSTESNRPPDVEQQEHLPDVLVPQPQSGSAQRAAPGSDANILEALNTFSRLTPEQKRVLVPVLSTMATPPSVTGEDDAPPSYHD